MSIFSLFGTKAKRSLAGAEQSLVGYLARTDFATVEAHQIGQYEDALDKLTEQMAAAEAVMDEEVRQAKVEHDNFDRALLDINKISTALAEGSVADAKKPAFEAHLAKLVADTEIVKAKVDKEQGEADDAIEHFNLLKDAVQSAAKRLVDAKDILAGKKRELEQAVVSEQREAEREEQRKVLLGIKEQTDTIGSVIGALDQEIAKKKQSAKASKHAADALGAGMKANVADADVAAFLGSSDAAPAMSVSDRIAALTAAKAGK